MKRWIDRALNKNKKKRSAQITREKAKNEIKKSRISFHSFSLKTKNYISLHDVLSFIGNKSDATINFDGLKEILLEILQNIRDNPNSPKNCKIISV